MSDDGSLRYHERMREAREHELREIRASNTWRALNRLRAFKHRWLDRWLVRLRRGTSSHAMPATAMPRGERFDVICLPIIDWDFRFQRPQQLMTQFAEHGHRVFYVRRGDGPAIEKRANVFGVSARDLEIASDTVVFVQHPSWWPFAKHLGARIVYDCMDHHAGFATEVADRNERALMAGAELVVVTSSALETAARAIAKDVLVVRNGCDYEHFARTRRAAGPRPVIGYYGAISDWFDVALVGELARRHPEWDFLLIGATYGADVLPLTAHPNVALPGERPYAELPGWLGVMDVCIIPFVRNALTEATNPVKVYEMLAAGKPVVSVSIPEVAALQPLVRVADDVEAFERAIVAALHDDDDAAVEARRAFASGQTWRQRYELLSDTLRSR